MAETQYSRITGLAPGHNDRDASAVEALGDVWRERLADMRGSPALERFNEQLYRSWAIETGILERLYSIDRGVTQILVERGLDISLLEHGSTDRPPAEVIEILRDHRDTVDYIMDFVSGNQEISLHFVRSLHQSLTRNQDKVDAVDQFGNHISLPLLKGTWKEIANNPTRPDGAIHAYCPPELVQEEMENLLRFLAEAFRGGVPTTVISSWLHHRFTQIHPFQDGNGRVARALAAFVFIKSSMFPIVIDRDDRGVYIDALERADSGDLKPLISLWNRLERQSIEYALGLVDTVTEKSNFPPPSLLREKLLEAIGDRAKRRREAKQNKLNKVLETGRSVYKDLIEREMSGLQQALENILHQADPTFECTVDRVTGEKGHWFKAQLVAVAQKYGYFCDLSYYHEWSRLKIRYGENNDGQSVEMVISLHSLGREFSGVLVMSGFVAERSRDDDGRFVTNEPRKVSERPLSFTYAEPIEQVKERAKEWLDDAVNVALENFRGIL